MPEFGVVNAGVWSLWNWPQDQACLSFHFVVDVVPYSKIAALFLRTFDFFEIEKNVKSQSIPGGLKHKSTIKTIVIAGQKKVNHLTLRKWSK